MQGRERVGVYLSVRYVCIVRASGCLSERVMCVGFESVSNVESVCEKADA